MRKEIQGFIAGVIMTTMLTSAAFAAGAYQTISVLFNSVNIAVNGQLVAADNILYNDRTYVPLAAVATLLGKDVVWDGNTNTANINDKGMTTQPGLPAATSYSRTNPAPIGVMQRVTVKNILDNFTAEVTVKEITRGSQAWDKIKAANMFNAPAGADEEYILAKISIKAVDVAGGKSLAVSPVNFELFSKDNVKYTGFYSVVTPEPSISTSLYPGAQHEGYAAFKVKKTDINPRIAYGLGYDGTGGIWFNLNK